MSETLALRRVPSLRKVAIQQLKLIDQAKRFTLLFALLGMASAVGQVPFSRFDLSALFPLTSLIVATQIWPLLVWHDEKPSRRAYHRFLPVDHFEHDLLKVAAGAGYLVIAIALVMLTLTAIALVAGLGKLVGGITFPVWLNFFTAPLIVYLMASVVPILAERPMEWLIGLGVAVAGLGFALQSVSSQLYIAVFNPILDDGYYSLFSALGGAYFRHPWMGEMARRVGPTTGQWLLATILWLALALGAVCIASRVANRRAVV